MRRARALRARCAGALDGAGARPPWPGGSPRPPSGLRGPSPVLRGAPVPVCCAAEPLQHIQRYAAGSRPRKGAAPFFPAPGPRGGSGRGCGGAGRALRRDQPPLGLSAPGPPPAPRPRQLPQAARAAARGGRCGVPGRAGGVARPRACLGLGAALRPSAGSLGGRPCGSPCVPCAPARAPAGAPSVAPAQKRWGRCAARCAGCGPWRGLGLRGSPRELAGGPALAGDRAGPFRTSAPARAVGLGFRACGRGRGLRRRRRRRSCACCTALLSPACTVLPNFVEKVRFMLTSRGRRWYDMLVKGGRPPRVWSMPVFHALPLDNSPAWVYHTPDGCTRPSYFGKSPRPRPWCFARRLGGVQPSGAPFAFPVIRGRYLMRPGSGSSSELRLGGCGEPLL